MINSIVVGMGEVGTALFEIISKNYSCEGLDKGDWVEDTCKYLNICIPYSKSFVEVVNDYITRYSPKLTIIHSSVPVGTTKLVNGMVVHSPTLGRHTEGLEYGLRTYPKYVGYDDLIAGGMAETYLGKFFKVKLVPGSKTTEIMKILCLLRYGLHLEVADVMNDICKEYSVNYNEVVKEWDRNYNEGIKNRNPEMQRPIYDAPNNKIGGHCVIPVTKIFNEQYKSEYIDRFLKRYDVK